MNFFRCLHQHYIANQCMQNSRILTLQKSAKVLFQMLFWVPVIGFSLLLIYNTKVISIIPVFISISLREPYA